MKKRKQFALNKLFNFCVVFGLFFAYCSIVCFQDNDATLGLVFGAIALAFIVLPAMFTPYCYTFDSEGVSLRYIFLPTERYLWKDIHAIEVEDISTYNSDEAIVYLFYAIVFSIKGTNVGKRRFYMNGHIRKSLRTKYLLEKYWDGTITGYMFEDTKKWIDKRKTKKQSQIPK